MGEYLNVLEVDDIKDGEMKEVNAAGQGFVPHRGRDISRDK